MTKRALAMAAGFLSVCLSSSAEPTDRLDLFTALNSSSDQITSVTLSDARRVSLSGAIASPLSFGLMEPTLPGPLSGSTDGFAMANVRPGSKDTVRQAPDDYSKEDVDVRRNPLGYVGGEMGFLYGRSTGKFGREVEAGYILGEVGTDKFQITVGASYENSSGRFPRFGR